MSLAAETLYNLVKAAPPAEQKKLLRLLQRDIAAEEQPEPKQPPLKVTTKEQYIEYLLAHYFAPKVPKDHHGNNATLTVIRGGGESETPAFLVSGQPPVIH